LELNAYLNASLLQFQNVCNPPVYHAVAGTTFSLLDQWRTIASIDALSPPRHAYGPRSFIREQAFDSTRIIEHGGAGSPTAWRPTGLVGEDTLTTRLYVECPLGKPCVLTFVDDEIFGSFDELVENESLAIALAKLRERYGLRIGSAVIFYTDNTHKIVFGSIDPRVSLQTLSDRETQRFLSVLAATLMKENYDVQYVT
jgi:hypothetical protein